MSIRKQLREGLLNALWRLISTHPASVIAVGLILAIISASLSFLFLRLNSDQDKLVSPDVPFQKRYIEHLKNFGDQEYLYVVIKTGGTEAGKKGAIQFAEVLNRRLGQHQDLIQAVYYRISAEDLGSGALLFASPQEAEALSKTILFLAPFIDTWIRDGSLSGFLEMVARLLGGPARHGEEGSAPDMDPVIMGQALDVLKDFLKNMDDILLEKAPYKPVFDLSQTGSRYFFTSSGKLLVMRLLPDKDFSTMDVIRKPLQVVRQAIKATRAEFPDIEAGLTGRPALQADEMETTDRDMTRAALIAVALIAILFTAILHGWLRPFLLLISLIMAIAWSFGFATITVGELNLLSIIFALVLVGIGVDFGIHMVMRYVEANKSGLSVDDAVHTTIFRTGPGIILAAITSVCAFYSVLGADFIGLAELGLIGGTGVLLCLLSMMTVLPAMLLIAGRRKLFPSSVPKVTALPFLERLSIRPGWTLLILVAITLAGLPGLLKVRFNYNLLELQARGLESVEYERTLIEASDESTWYAILTADNLKDVKRLTKTLKAIPSVGKVESILDFIPTKQARKSAIYEEAAKALEHIPANPLPSPPLNPERLIRALSRLSYALEGLEEKLFAAGAGSELAQIDQDLEYIRSASGLLEQDRKRARLLKGLQTGLGRDIEKSLKQLKLWLSAGSVTPEDLPPSLRDLYVGKDGSYQIKVIPKGDVWDFGALEHFVSELRRVDPDVSGVPVAVLESARMMHRTFLFAAALTIVLVALILWLYSRSFRYVFLTLLPLGTSMLWLLEIMGWFGLHFNLANFFAIPILIAIGVDGGVHLLARSGELLYQPGGALPDRNGLFHTSTPTAVALSFATTMIGFGGLLFAHHRGLASLGGVMVLGSLMGMLACLLVLPPALKLMGRR
ncbi:MAG: MMPL family transporter [Desulfobacteraceae bacterium]|nr:MMPL family transporter [Desulfobacteraceae bacterium]